MTEQEYKAVQELVITALAHLDAATGSLRSAHLADHAFDRTLAAEYRAMFHQHILAAGELLAAIRSQNLLHACEMNVS